MAVLVSRKSVVSVPTAPYLSSRQVPESISVDMSFHHDPDFFFRVGAIRKTSCPDASIRHNALDVASRTCRLRKFLNFFSVVAIPLSADNSLFVPGILTGRYHRTAHSPERYATNK